VIGRIDDVVNVSGHRLSTAEVESAIVARRGRRAAGLASATTHTGQAIVAFVTLQGDAEGGDGDLRGHPRDGGGAIGKFPAPSA
jgi:acetyl-CoA synthetase